MAYGSISPAKIIKNTDIATARKGGTTLSKKIGSASNENALPTNSVHNKI
jgi:hypothetical protein